MTSPASPASPSNPDASRLTGAPDVRRTVWVEVSNTLAVDYVTGFQRHTRELLARLQRLDGPVAYVPVRWCTECGTFRRLTVAEAAALAEFVPPTTPQRSRLAELTDPLPGGVQRFARTVIRTKPVHSAREELARRRRIRNHPPEHATLRIDAWPDESWFFDLEAAWHNTLIARSCCHGSASVACTPPRSSPT